MTEISTVEELRKSLGKRSKITLIDRLKNIEKNIEKNILAFMLPIIGAGSVCAAIGLGQKAQNIIDANRGYSKAYKQMVELDQFLKTDPTFMHARQLLQKH